MMAILFILCAIALSAFNGMFDLELETSYIVVLSLLISIAIVLNDIFKQVNNKEGR